MKKFNMILIVILAVLMISCSSISKKPVDYVNPFIGTDWNGHTYPGVSFPFGMVQLSPDTKTKGWENCSGYHLKDKSIMGFSHTHLSGTGASDLGDIRFMPTVGELIVEPGTDENPDAGYRSRFNHESEKAYPGYYSVYLEDYNIRVELTASKRVGLQRYTFPGTATGNIIIDLTHGIHDVPSDLYIKFTDKNEIVGYRRSSGWANDHCVYFVAEFSKPFERCGVAINGKIELDSEEGQGKNLVGFVRFNTVKNEKVLVKVGLSAVSIKGARKNLEFEMEGWDFEQASSDAKEVWNKTLSKITIEGGTLKERVNFYTALYHCYLAPNIYMDVDKKYRGMDGKIHQAEDFDNYTVFSLWDTFRALHPLFTIIEPEVTIDFIKTFLKKYEQSGLLPVWELAANETNCMIGYHSIPVITDAYIKGLRNFDVEAVYKAMKTSAEQDQFGLKYYRKYGYLPANLGVESVSRTLEYAYDDWCIAMLAKEMGKGSDYKRYIERAMFYRNLFDPGTNLMRPKSAAKWKEPFDPREVTHDFTEANSWQYSFFVPQDMENLIALHGGDDNFVKKMDEMFSEKDELEGEQRADITGMIGQYAHGNEPSHHMAYLYNYAGAPWKTQEIVREVMAKLYTPERDGLCGNEDCGQMSAWYVFSALGFYPVCPGRDYYVIGSPIFDKATIDFGNGRTFEIIAEKVSKDNKYIQSARMNGISYSKSYILHKDIISGGSVIFEMGNKPNKIWGKMKSDRPYSRINEKFLSAPTFSYDNTTFYDKQTVTIDCIDKDAVIHYTIDGNEPSKDSPIYKAPILITERTLLKAIAYSKECSSRIAEAELIKILKGYSIKLNTEYASRYSGCGRNALINYIRGTENLFSGVWQGYEATDLDAVVDLGNVKKINRIATGFAQDIGSWIFMPRYVEYYISDDGEEFQKIATVKNEVSDRERGTIIREFESKFNNINARYIRVKAKNIDFCPEWHQGAGGKAWIFVDEMVIE